MKIFAYKHMLKGPLFIASVTMMLIGLLGPPASQAQFTRGELFLAPGHGKPADLDGTLFHLGGGFERLLDRGIGAGAELGGVIPGTGPIDKTLGLFSINGAYHLRAERTLDPVVSAGYSVLFRDFTENRFNFGGAIHYWVHDNSGMIFGFRDYVGHGKGEPTGSYWEFRIGFVFR